MDGDQFAADLSAAQAGDDAAFLRLWLQTHPVLLRFLAVRAPDVAEDVASETWLAALPQLKDFEGTEGGFRGWLVTIARHKLVDVRRRSARRPEVLGATPMTEEPRVPDAAELAAERQATEDALRLIATLPTDVAEMVALRVVVGLDVGEVAAVVGKRPGTVRVAVHRGLRRLAATLAEQHADAGVTLELASTIQGRHD
ncbi:MAG TPA: RNA polymerase sigma factor [Actinomycetales bacterium]|nr:RNA polymerase sigma factor [Actinomycetales bacterium]